jgi:hypothetical protein
MVLSRRRVHDTGVKYGIGATGNDFLDGLARLPQPFHPAPPCGMIHGHDQRVSIGLTNVMKSSCYHATIVERRLGVSKIR